MKNQEKIKLAIDAMGGDNAPLSVVEGINNFASKNSNVEFLLYGDERTLVSMLLRYPYAKECCRIIPTQTVISGEEKPSKALRMSAGSSMGEAISAVKNGEAGGVVSAGNTGALMAIAKIALRMLPGISRPAICTMMPTINEKGLPVTMLDLGANALVDPQNLFEFAVMGGLYFSTITGVEKPSLGLLNIGSEDNKGLEYIKDAADLIRSHDNLNFDFKGFVESDGILAGNINVVVSDGFSGNIALKAIEGTAKVFAKMLKKAFFKNIFTKLALLIAALPLKSLKEEVNPSNYNGAMMIGLNGVVIKSHGGADGNSFANAVSYAAKIVRSKLNDKIRTEVEAMSALSNAKEKEPVTETNEKVES